MSAPESERKCDHGYGPVTGIAHGLTVVHGWWWVYVRCWYCDLKVRVGNRWNLRTIGDGLHALGGTDEGVLLSLAGVRPRPSGDGGASS